MNLEFLQDIKVDWLPMPPLLLEVGFILLAVAIWRYGRVLGELLQIIDKPPIEVLISIAAWVIVLTFSIPHYIVSAVYYPNLGADQAMFQFLGVFRTLSFVGLFIAAVLVLVPSLLYFWWTTRE
jgi:hypothetical protein